MSDIKVDLNADFSIDLKTAQTYARNWRDSGSILDYRSVHAFLIPTDNLQLLLDQRPTDSIAVRAYLGIDENGQPKLMIVGTIPSRSTNTHDDMLPGSSTPGKIYDFTRPCPPACGYMSPLNDLP